MRWPSRRDLMAHEGSVATESPQTQGGSSDPPCRNITGYDVSCFQIPKKNVLLFPTARNLVQKQYQGGIMVLIHGAYQSSTSFAFLKHLLPQYQFISLGWDVKGKFNQNLKEMRSILKEHAPLYFVGHSMGGIYAAHLSESVNCIGGTAVSVPWGGSKAADWMKYIVPRHLLYHEVATSSPIVVKARTNEASRDMEEHCHNPWR